MERNEECPIMFTNIVVGAGPSETARGAVAAAIDLASTHDASLHIVFAVTGDSGPNRTATGGYVNTDHRANPLLEELAAEAESSGVTTKVHARSESPADALVSVAGDEGADLIVVGNKGMKGKVRLLGSVPNTVAHSAPCSVLIVDTIGSTSD